MLMAGHKNIKENDFILMPVWKIIPDQELQTEQKFIDRDDNGNYK